MTNSFDLQEVDKLNAESHIDATFVKNSTIHGDFDNKTRLEWKKVNKLKTNVERRSSDVTLEKMHAGDRRENETICASLKKYQTLPPKIALGSLVGVIGVILV